MTRRSSGVAGSNYITHIAGTHERTMCNRCTSAVNVQPIVEGVSESTCRLCAKHVCAVCKGIGKVRAAYSVAGHRPLVGCRSCGGAS